MRNLNRDQVLNLVVYATMLLLASSMVIGANVYDDRERLIPLVIGIPTVLLLVGIVVVELWPGLAKWNRAIGGGEDEPAPTASATGINAGAWRRVVRVFGWLVGFFVLTFILGYYVSVPIFLVAFLVKEAQVSPKVALGATAASVVIFFLLFNLLLDIPMWPGVLPRILPGILGGGSIPPLYRGL